jgi:uncharacterized iron-regulated membrane protein
MTPNQVHYGQTNAVYVVRQETLDRVYRAYPERFVWKASALPEKPTVVWINPPATAEKWRAQFANPGVS